MHAYSWVDISADWKSYCCGCTCGLDLVLSPHLNSDLAWIQIAGVFTLRYPLVLSASIVLEYCAWTLSVNIANVLISSVSQIQRRIQGRGPGAQDPLSVRPNWGPKGRKKCFGDCPPTYLRVWMPPPLISWSGCGTEIGPVVTMSLHCVGTFLATFVNNTCLFGSNSWLHVTDAGYVCKSVRDGQIATVRQLALATHFNTK